MFVVAARMRAKMGEGDKLADAFREMVAWVAANEPDTVTYACNRGVDDLDRFFIFERHASKGAFEAHTTSPRFLDLASRIQPWIEGAIEIETFTEIAAKL